MAKAAFAREPFDRNRAFIVAREFIVSGCVLGPGEPFNKGLVTDRRLKQLYEQRFLKLGEGTDGSSDFAKPLAFGEAVMGNVPVKKPQEPDKGGFLGTGLPVVPYHKEKITEEAPVVDESAPAEPQVEFKELPVAEPVAVEVKKTNPDGRPDFDSMSRDELVQYLEAEPTVIVRKGWGPARLAFLAASKWKEQQRGATGTKPQE